MPVYGWLRYNFGPTSNPQVDYYLSYENNYESNFTIYDLNSSFPAYNYPLTDAYLTGTNYGLYFATGHFPGGGSGRITLLM